MTASVIAETPLICIRLSRSALDRLLRNQPDIAVRVIHVLASRMTELVKEPVH